jgi:hypothetical protein
MGVYCVVDLGTAMGAGGGGRGAKRRKERLETNRGEDNELQFDR